MKYIRHSWTMLPIRKLEGPNVIGEDLTGTKLSHGLFSNRSSLAGISIVAILAAVYYIIYRRFLSSVSASSFGFDALIVVGILEIGNEVAKKPRALPFVAVLASSSLYALGYIASLTCHSSSFRFANILAPLATGVSSGAIGKCFGRVIERYRERLIVEDTDFSGADLSSSEWSDVIVSGCTFQNADMKETKVSDAQITDCVYTSSVMYDIKMISLTCTRTTFENASIKSAEFKDSTFTECCFDHCELHGTNFGNCKFEGTSFHSADLGSAVLKKATFTNVDMIGATANRFTKWPTGFNPTELGIIFADQPTEPQPALSEDAA